MLRGPFSQVSVTDLELSEGVTVAGGREGLVGVGGLLLGGGVSPHTKHYECPRLDRLTSDADLILQLPCRLCMR